MSTLVDLFIFYAKLAGFRDYLNLSGKPLKTNAEENSLKYIYDNKQQSEKLRRIFSLNILYISIYFLNEDR